MPSNFSNLIKKHNLKIRGILHIGGHYGQEMEQYEKEAIKHIVFFEPLTKNFDVLKEKVGDKGILVKTALGSKVGKSIMYVESANNGQSSSILEPNLHLKQYPHIMFNEKEEVDLNTLDNFMSNANLNKDDYNMINVDVQGYELEVFKGSSETLNKIDYIKSEINTDELYTNCAKVWELDEFLQRFGFERVETDLSDNSWGDALYVKKKFKRNIIAKFYQKFLTFVKSWPN